ncbi:MAG: hypothetical protein PHY46_03980 [Candidatus Omnitrophica bacterium]|nr:hypothetical protein [Candidatus Omnitrophota bacterium]MDD5355817.1 hypothetical protein [Candidatus Omnitrophota bacterium]
MYNVVQSLGALVVVPATVLLTFSFFVLFVIRKLEAGKLKIFGKVVVILLWVCAALVLCAGICPQLTGRCPMGKKPMHKMMKGGMGYPMMKGDMDYKMMKEKMPSPDMAQ